VALIWFGLAGIILSYFYTAPPLRIGYRGFGEIIVFLICGPLSVIGTYFLFTGMITLKSVLLSIPIGLLIFSILFINEFPDYEADKAVNKRHLVVRMGRQKQNRIYFCYYTYIFVSNYTNSIKDISPLPIDIFIDLAACL